MHTAHTNTTALDGGVTATVIHLEDETGPVIAAQITAPDEPLTVDEVDALAAALARLAADMRGSA